MVAVFNENDVLITFSQYSASYDVGRAEYPIENLVAWVCFPSGRGNEGHVARGLINSIRAQYQKLHPPASEPVYPEYDEYDQSEDG